jgi:hypothetical protein
LVVFQPGALALDHSLGESRCFFAEVLPGVFGRFISGVSTPIKRTRSPVSRRSMSSSHDAVYVLNISCGDADVG